MEELRREGLAEGWLVKGLRYLADGHTASEVFKTYVHITSLFTLTYKQHQDNDHFVVNEKAGEKILPTGVASVDKKNLTWLIRRSDQYAEGLSASALHCGFTAHAAQVYRRALKLIEILGFREEKEPSLEASPRVEVTSFALSALYGMKWGDDSGSMKLQTQSQGIRGCSPGLVKFAIACLRLPSAKQFFFACGTTLNPEHSAKARQLIINASYVHLNKHDHSFEKNFLLAPVVCPEVGIIEWVLKQKKARKALKAIQTRASKPPYDLIEGYDEIARLVSFDDSDGEEESGDEEEEGDAEVDEDDKNGISDGEREEARGKQSQLRKQDLRDTRRGGMTKGKESSASKSCVELEESGDEEEEGEADVDEDGISDGEREEARRKESQPRKQDLRDTKRGGVAKGKESSASKSCVELDEEEENEATVQRKLVTILDKATERCRQSKDCLQTTPEQRNKRRRCLSPLRLRDTKRRERLVLPPQRDLGHPSCKENFKAGWSWSRIREAQRKIPGTCRKLPGECTPWVGERVGEDGRYRVCRYSHPWILQ